MDEMGEKSNGCISLIMWNVICENEANWGNFLGKGDRIKKSNTRAYATRAKKIVFCFYALGQVKNQPH